jgi:phospholipase/carboxylesterase
MDDRTFEDLTRLLPALLRSLEGLGFVARHFHPPNFGTVLQAVGTPEDELREARPRLDDWPDELAGVADCLKRASDAAIEGYDLLRNIDEGPGDGMRGVYRALGRLPRAQEAVYPLAADLPPVSRHFLSPDTRGDEALIAALAEAGNRDDAGVLHSDDEPGTRGGYSLYVPETYDPDAPPPLVVAMHGGAGNGRSFLWTWLRDARGHGAIVISPTAVGDTWALSGPDVDTPNLMRILDEVEGRWPFDKTRMLLTGMSDGGTFAYVSGLDPRSPFTHLAPISAAFHPMLAAMADAERLNGLPIQITHGRLDWMFPFSMAREARDALAEAGAAVTYREIADLSHTYPREVNAELLHWLKG